MWRPADYDPIALHRPRAPASALAVCAAVLCAAAAAWFAWVDY
jgi:hypothetical protein